MGDRGKTCKSLSRVESCEVTDGNGNARKRKHVTMNGEQRVGLGVTCCSELVLCLGTYQQRRLLRPHANSR